MSEPFVARLSRNRMIVGKSLRLYSLLPFDRFAIEDSSTKLSMMSFLCPPAPDGLSYVSEWATESRDITVRIQFGVRVHSVGLEYSGINRTILCKNIGINVCIAA